MAMGPSSSSKTVKNDINITPLVDVVLVLLIIFMVITPMLQRGKDVTLPKAHKTGSEDKSGNPLVVSVTSDKRVWLESNAVPIEEIEQKIADELVKNPNRRVLLKGDQSVTVGSVRRVMDHAKKAGALSVELAVEEVKGKS
jgi:biopolymer transport protein TolR